MTWLTKVVLLIVSLAVSEAAPPTNEELVLLHAQDTVMSSTIGLDVDETHLDQMRETGGIPMAYERVLEYLTIKAKSCSPLNKYRRTEGVCNNLQNPLWGASLAYQLRIFNTKKAKEVMGDTHKSNAYLDGKGIPRMTGYKNNYLPSSRRVSVDCFPDTKENENFFDQKATQMHMQWGQYLDHDIVHTEATSAKTAGGSCCSDPRHKCVHPDTFSGGPCFPIGIDEGDRYFNGSCMNFKRSFSVEIDGVQEQINGVTSFVDGSTVYGSHIEHEKSLRSMMGGKLRVGDDNTLPRHGTFKCRKEFNHGNACPIAGDMRVNVFGGLTILHLTFVREHNRIAEKLQSINPHWTDEIIFQETKKIIGALHQKISYEDYIPIMLGKKAMDFFGLQPNNYTYKPETNPSIVNEFAVAAFRFGHVMVNAKLPMNGKNEPISANFFKPSYAMANEWQIKKIVKSQCKRKAQKCDYHFTSELTDKLFLDVDGIGHSTDLGARNIQRGRDHGALPYLDYFNLALRAFLREVHNVSYSAVLPDCLKKQNYDVVEDLDLFVGGLYEKPIDDGLVGPTFAYILGDQFQRLKDGDRFFYETDDSTVGFTEKQLKEIKKQYLSSILCRNTQIKGMPRDAFIVESRTNVKIPCGQFDDLDLTHWKEDPPTNSFDNV